MRIQQYNKHSKRPAQGGYVALMVTIIASILLLSMVAQEGFAGFHARFTVLGTERKEQANALAEGCADQAFASVIADPLYSGAILNTLPAGTCYVAPVEISTGTTTIRVQSQVGNNTSGGTTYSNLAFTIGTNGINTMRAGATSTMGTLLVQTLVQNNKNTSASPGDFTMTINSNGAQLSSFAGSAAGVTVHVAAGNYSVSETKIAGFVIAGQPGCSGTIAAGEVKTCSVLNATVTTTLTLVDSVVNDNKGQQQPTDFDLLIDGISAPFGSAVDITPGSHTLDIASSTMSGYLSSADWSCLPQSAGKSNGSGGIVDISAGDNKVCVVKIDDIPPPNPSCADTVMMLDRTGSMSSTERTFEKSAANALVNLYSQVHVNSPNLPIPVLGVGSFGGITSTASTSALVPNNPVDGSGFLGIMTTVYSDITNAISQMMGSGSCSSYGSSDNCTDLSAAIQAGADELNSSRHSPANQKVLFLIADGVPSLPTGTTVTSTGTTSPSANAPDGSTSWISPTDAYTGADGGKEALTTIGSGVSKHQFSGFSFPDIPGDATGFGIEVDADAWATSLTGASVTSPLYPSATGSFSNWTTNTGTDVSAVGSKDASDSTYITTSGSSATFMHTFNVTNATAVPSSGATIDAVTLHVIAKSTTAGAPLQFVVEKDANNVYTSAPISLTTSFTSYTYSFPTTGDNKSWTSSEVRSWTNSFGVAASSSKPVQVAQMYVTVNYH